MATLVVEGEIVTPLSLAAVGVRLGRILITTSWNGERVLVLHLAKKITCLPFWESVSQKKILRKR